MKRVISFVLHLVPAIGSPRDFIRFSRCQFCRSPAHSGFKRMYARGWGETVINANHSSRAVTAARSFSQKSVTFLLEWFVMMIEVPKRSTYVSIGTDSRPLWGNWNIEPSRAIPRRKTRPPAGRRCSSDTAKSTVFSPKSAMSLRFGERAHT